MGCEVISGPGPQEVSLNGQPIDVINSNNTMATEATLQGLSNITGQTYDLLTTFLSDLDAIASNTGHLESIDLNTSLLEPLANIGYGDPETQPRIVAYIGYGNEAVTEGNPLPVVIPTGTVITVGGTVGLSSTPQVNVQSSSGTSIQSGFGSAANGLRIAALLGIGTTAISNTNPVPEISGYTKPTMTGVSANNTNLVSADCLGARTVSITVTGTFVAVVEFQLSDDNTNFVQAPLVAIAAGAETSGTNIATPGTYFGRIRGQQFYRFRTTAYTSGTINSNATLSSYLV